jgi:hypothetical protein
MSAVPRFIRFQPTVLATLSFAWCSASTAFENGPPAEHTGALGQPDCSVCHFDNELNFQGGAVKLSGVPATYLAGQQYTITVTLEHSVLPIGGFQLAIQDIAGDPAGELTANQDDVKTMIADGTKQVYVQHGKPRRKHDDDTQIQWTIVWTAPDDQRDLIIAVAAVAANDDASALGDNVYTATARMNSSGVDLIDED